jgi:hypothetical protein
VRQKERISWRGLMSLGANKAIACAVESGLARKESDTIRCVVGAGYATRGADIVNTFDTSSEVYTTAVIILGQVRTIEMRASRKGAADAEYDRCGHQGPFDLFHTNEFNLKRCTRSSGKNFKAISSG